VTNSTPANQTIGYCTNVHAGVDLSSICKNLEQFAVPARVASGSETLGVGLWLPAQAAAELANNAEEFRKFLIDRQLRPFTINGFPYDNFHQKVVKHRVYKPTWWQQERLDYTKQLADILAVLLPEDEPVGSISTLPIGWPSESDSQAQLDQAGANLRQLATHLQQVEARTGRRIVVAIEPEPGCILDTTDDVIQWFDKYLPDSSHRRSITVCHDVCHSAVMMEPQVEVLRRLAEAGISVGKIQVSSAIVAELGSMTAEQRLEAISQLSEFAEDRYLHQTGRRTASGAFELAGDLPDLLSLACDPSDPVGGDEKWVIHFHVPIFLQRFGLLSTSQSDVLECLRFLMSADCELDFTGHLEIETYAWTVLPESMRKRGLAEDIASEVTWLRDSITESK
jgi:sugar phosphate isomerase/epimerase